TGNVLGNDVGVGLSANVRQLPAHGALTLNPDGSFDYAPDTDFSGDDAFLYYVTDSASRNSPNNAVVQVTVLPAVSDDQYNTPINGPVSGNVLTNDHGSGLHITSHHNPSHGALNIASDGSFTYVPAPGFSGSDSFGYGVTDASFHSANALVQIAIAQSATPDFVSTLANTPVSGNVLSNDSGTGLSVVGNTQPAHGSANVAPDGSFTYFPDNNFSGSDSFVYSSKDGGNNPANAVVFVTVDPVIISDSFTTPAGTPATGNVLSNDLGTGLSVTSHTPASHGSVALAADGSLTYTPAAGFSGFDSFQYDIQDSAGDTASSNAAVQIDVTPIAAPDAFAGQGSIHGNVLGNDTGTGLQVTGTPVLPAHGFANVAPDGSFTYVPNPGYHGADSFQYTVQDSSGQNATGTVTINVAAAVQVTPAPATTPAALGLLATLLGWLGLRRRRDT
ncbi:MAG TPA: Ig-like domain-containing protein, partial [Rudaea sp.]